MSIFLKILLALLLVIVIILILLLILVMLKCKYVINLAYEKKKLSFDFKALFFTFYLLLDLSKKMKPDFKVMIFNIIITDSSKRKKDDDISRGGKSIAKSRFLKNKKLEKEINVDKKIFANLFARSKEYMKVIRDNVKMIGDKNKSIETTLEKKISKIFPKDIMHVVKLTISELKKYCMDLSPKKLSVDANFGFSEPHYTGILLALLTPLYSKYGDDIKIKPNFSLRGLNAKIYMEGMLQIIRIVIPTIHLLLDKKFRKVVFKETSNK